MTLGGLARSVPFLMSTKPPSTGSTGSISARRAERFFDREIWYDHQICSNCFTLLKGRFAGEFENRKGKLVEIDHSWRTPEATLGEAHEEPPEEVASVIPLARARTTCEACGSVRGLSQGETLSKEAALERAKTLAERLREKGFDVDESLMLFTVGHCKATPRLAGDDKRIFATAAAYGVDL